MSIFTTKFLNKQILLVVLFSLYGYIIQAQNIGINSTGNAPDASAILDIVTTDKGLLIPRVSISNALTTAPVTAPATSLLVYNTFAGITSGNGVGYYYWNGSQWVKFLDGTSGDAWLLAGNSGTTAGTDFIGTTDAVDWVIKTNNTERMRVMSAGNIGISTATPISNTIVHVEDAKAVLFDGGSLGSGGALNLGSSIRMMWYPKKASFRAGRVTSTQWNDANIGNYSTAFGYNNIESGGYGFVTGQTNSSSGTHNLISGINNSATGDYNMIGGENNDVHASAIGDVSNNIVNGKNNDYGTYGIVQGFSNQSTNSYATINGQSNNITGSMGTSFGASNAISGDFNTAIGLFVIITGDNSFANGGGIGTGITLNGNYDFATGNAITISSSGTHNFASGNTINITGTGSYNYAGGTSVTETGTGFNHSHGVLINSSGSFSANFGIGITNSGGFNLNSGNTVTNSGTHSLATGQTITNSGAHSQVSGTSNTNSGDRSFLLGSDLTNTGNDANLFGDALENDKIYTTTIGLGQIAVGQLQVQNDYTFGVGYQYTLPTFVVHCSTIGQYGNVGIGVQTPTESLHIAGTFRLVDGTQGAGLVLTSDANGVGTWQAGGGGGGSDDDWHEVGTSTAPNAITDNIFTQGNVGIGIISPVDPLHVVSDAAGDAIHLEENVGGEDWQIGIDASGDLNFEDSGFNRVTFEDGGQVGFGTATPAYNLEIEENSTATAAMLYLDQLGTGDAQMVFNAGSQFIAMGIDNSDSDKFKISDNSTLGTNDRFVLTTAGDIGIGIGSPDAKLDVAGPGTGDIATVMVRANIFTMNTSVSGYGFSLHPTAPSKGAIYYESSAGGWNEGDIVFAFGHSSDWSTPVATTDETMRLSNNGNLCLGVSAAAGGQTTSFIFALGNGSAPSSSITDGIQLYAQDVAASSELRVRDEAGNVTTLSPHNFSIIPSGTSNQLGWAYYSEHSPSNRAINVDMLALAKEVEKLSGKNLIYTANLDNKKEDGTFSKIDKVDPVDNSLNKLVEEQSIIIKELKKRIEVLEEKN